MSVPGDDSGLPPLPLPGASPPEVRAALRPEYREEFDRAYRRALDDDRDGMSDLSEAEQVLESWRRRSWFTRDKERFREMIRRAVFLLTGEEPPEDEPVEVTEARLERIEPTRRAGAASD